MKRGFKPILTLLVLGLMAWSVWNLWFNEPRKIRKLIQQLAEDVSFSPRDGNIARMASVEAVTSKLTADAEVQVDSAGFPARTLSGRDEIREVMALSRGLDGGVQVQVFDIVVTLGPGDGEAQAALTANAKVGGTEVVAAQEFLFKLRKEEKRWKVQRIQAVRTLQK